MSAGQDMEIIGLQKYDLPLDVFMLLVPLPESRTGIHFLPNYSQKKSQILSNCNLILGKHENIYFVYFNLKVKERWFMLQKECFNQFCYMSENVSSSCFLFALFLSIFLPLFHLSHRKRGSE